MRTCYSARTQPLVLFFFAGPDAGALAGQAMHALSHVLAQRRLWPEAVELARGAVARLPGQQHARAWLERIAPRLQPLAASP